MSRYAENLTKMVNKMNEIGISNIYRYALKKYPRKNHKLNFDIIRHSAKNGYSECVVKFSISRQRAESILKEYYSYALEIEELKRKEDVILK